MSDIRELRSYLSNDTLLDIIAAHLTATSVIDDDEDVLTLRIGEVNEENKRPIYLEIIKMKEVELIVHS